MVECFKIHFSNVLLGIIGLVILNGCCKGERYLYNVHYFNNTHDTLMLTLGDASPAILNVHHHLKPLSGVKLEGYTVYNKENAIQEIVHCGYEAWAKITRNDSVLITWKGPSRYMPDSIHHIYNYNSWSSWFENDGTGIIEFKILSSDIE